MTALHLLWLVALGCLEVWLHETVRVPLNLPGRHGLEAMALLALARCSSRLGGAATVSAASAAAFSLLPGWRAEPLDPLFYFLPGPVFDAGWKAAPRVAGWPLAIALLAAFAHATKPVARAVVQQVSPLVYDSLAGGVLLPLATHLAFGFAGGLLGAATWRALRAAIRRPAS
ncbi:MAG TPA: hypothetical protein VIC56_05545, partial [Gemmatimonadota bacterium]